MRRLMNVVALWATVATAAASGTAVLAQAPGGAPGMPMQRLGPSRGQITGTPGAPMARMGRGSGMPQGSAPMRRSYGGIAGVPNIVSSQNFRASNLAGQARTGGMMRSSNDIVGGVTRGMVTVPSNPR